MYLNKLIYIFVFLNLSYPVDLFGMYSNVFDDQIFLNSSDRSQLINAVLNLSRVSKKIDGITPFCSMRCRQENNEYSLDITHLLPQRMREMIFQANLNCVGPNCYNAVLYFLNILPNLRYTTEQEFDFYIKRSGFFYRIEFEDQIQPGDVCVLRIGKQLLHAFINLGSNVAIEKSGAGKDDPYQIVEHKSILDHYSTCSRYYYRCMDRSAIERALESLRADFEEVDAIERNLVLHLNAQNFAPFIDDISPELRVKIIAFYKFDSSSYKLYADKEDVCYKVLFSRLDTLYQIMVSLMMQKKASIYTTSGFYGSGDFSRLRRNLRSFFYGYSCLYDSDLYQINWDSLEIL